MDKVKMSKVNV